MIEFRRRWLSRHNLNAAAIVLTVAGFIWLTWRVSDVQARQTEDRAVQRATVRSVQIQNDTWCTYIKAIVTRPGAPNSTFDKVNRDKYKALNCAATNGPLPN